MQIENEFHQESAPVLFGFGLASCPGHRPTRAAGSGGASLVGLVRVKTAVFVMGITSDGRGICPLAKDKEPPERPAA